MGLLLIGLHVWASLESYQVLGVFGWFFGDFFVSKEDFPNHLEYSGIYRYVPTKPDFFPSILKTGFFVPPHRCLNNPEMTGGAA